jgi:formate dehydrogenase subunit gamma
MATAETIERFGKTTRWFHWTFATSFLALAGTGATLALREALGFTPADTAFVVRAHLCAAVCLLVLPPLVLLSGETRRTLADLRELVRFTRDDLRWLALQPRAALGRAELPPVGKFNGGQKVNALALGALTGGLVATGLLLWLRPGSLAAWFVHVSLFVLWLPLFAAHFSLAVLLPGTRPALRGMVLGRVERAWAEHHHALWVRALDAAPHADAPRPAPAVPRPASPPRESVPVPALAGLELRRARAES